MDTFLTIVSWLAPPVLGGVIGYSTNALAIRMLFRPRTQKRFLRVPIPMTPGLIPRHHGLMASQIAQTVGKELLSEEAIRTALRGERGKGVARVRGFLKDRSVDLLVRLRRRMDVERIVEDRIKKYDTEKLEGMVRSVANQHLRWITWFGALLGAVIGCLQLVLNLVS